jgi:hypothetical protein
MSDKVQSPSDSPELEAAATLLKIQAVLNQANVRTTAIYLARAEDTQEVLSPVHALTAIQAMLGHAGTAVTAAYVQKFNTLGG